jgi:uncharacterized membrane protein
MISKRGRITELIEQGVIPEEKIGEALKAVGAIPSARAWRKFIDQSLLWLGGLFLAAAVLFFIAFNWQDLGRFAKFALVEGLLALAIVVYCRYDARAMAGKVALLGATILLGVLLALYGQTYQTGVDPWQLFFAWALMMLPWAFIGRLPALWIVWLALLNISLILYHRLFQGPFWIFDASGAMICWQVFILNTLALAVWELLSFKRHRMSPRWPVRLLAMGGGFPITLLVLRAILDHHGTAPAVVPVWLAWLAAVYFVYRNVQPDLFMLAEGCLSGITVIVVFFGKQLLRNADAGGFLFLALLVVGLGAGAAFWLNHIHRENGHGPIE